MLLSRYLRETYQYETQGVDESLSEFKEEKGRGVAYS